MAYQNWHLQHYQSKRADQMNETHHEITCSCPICGILWDSWWTITHKFNDSTNSTYHILGTCGNFQGLVYFYCVNNGKVVKQWCFTELPMPDSIIQCIEAAATNENMDMGIEFYHCDFQPFEVDEGNGENLESSSAYRDIPAEMPGVSIETNIFQPHPFMMSQICLITSLKQQLQQQKMLDYRTPPCPCRPWGCGHRHWIWWWRHNEWWEFPNMTCHLSWSWFGWGSQEWTWLFST